VGKNRDDRLRNWLNAILKKHTRAILITATLLVSILIASRIYSLYQAYVRTNEVLSEYLVIAQCEGEGGSNARVIKKDGEIFLYCGFGTSIPGIPIPK
jgi:hypothetical protein